MLLLYLYELLYISLFESSQREFEYTLFAIRCRIIKYDRITLYMGIKEIKGVVGLGKCYKIR